MQISIYHIGKFYSVLIETIPFIHNTSIFSAVMMRLSTISPNAHTSNFSAPFHSKQRTTDNFFCKLTFRMISFLLCSRKRYLT